MKSNPKTDKLSNRLVGIIVQLNQGKKLEVDELAFEFGVTARVIQKDLNERLNQFLPIVKENGCYFLENYLVGELGYKDIRSFAHISGIKKLYPNLQDEFLSDVLNKKISHACLVRGGNYEDIQNKQEAFEMIKLATTSIKEE